MGFFKESVAAVTQYITSRTMTKSGLLDAFCEKLIELVLNESILIDAKCPEVNRCSI